ncbi:MAG: hypothetical protein QM831_07305 [Kofleriaceae bacterium]
MKKLLVITIISLAAACGGKANKNTTPANKPDPSTGSGAMGGQTYGGGSGAMAPKPSSGGGDPCAM